MVDRSSVPEVSELQGGLVDFWELTDSEDSDQHNDGRGQPLSPLSVLRGDA